MKEKYQDLFKLKKPCENCPFLKEGAIELEEGRLEGIIESIMSDDNTVFHCHKTVHCDSGGDWDDEQGYKPSGYESVCAGSLIYLEKHKNPSVTMRIGRALGMYDPKRLQSSFDKVID